MPVLLAHADGRRRPQEMVGLEEHRRRGLGAGGLQLGRGTGWRPHGGWSTAGGRVLHLLHLPWCLVGLLTQRAEDGQGRLEHGAGETRMVMSEGDGHRRGGGCRLQWSSDQRCPDDWGWAGLGRSCFLDGLGHLSVMLHDLLDDLTLLVVQRSRVEVVLYLVQQDGVLLTCPKRQNRARTLDYYCRPGPNSVLTSD